jgi:hypothetical protein
MNFMMALIQPSSLGRKMGLQTFKENRNEMGNTASD